MLIDSHCHLNFEDFDADRQEVVSAALASGVQRIINPGVDLESTPQQLRLAAEYPGFVSLAVGVHPNYSTSWTPDAASAMEALAKNPAVVAIGEIGLDYYRDYAPKDTQQAVLREQLTLAARLGLPVIIHERDSSADLTDMLVDWCHALPSQSPLKQAPGVMHAYNGSLEQVTPLLEVGFCFGIGGPVTYKNAREKHALAAALPLNHILLETDAPFLPPHPHRGSRNEPAYIALVAERVAALRGISVEEVAQVTTQAACRLFNLPVPA